MSTAEGFRQEMPPKGGYAGIQWERIPLKKPWSGIKLISAYVLITAGSYWCYAQDITRKRNLRRINDEVTTALEPMLIAERDRSYLNHLRMNRDEERELMKNVPGWVVGQYYKEPLYTTIGDFLIEPYSIEYYAHTKEKHREYMHAYAMWM